MSRKSPKKEKALSHSVAPYSYKTLLAFLVNYLFVAAISLLAYFSIAYPILHNEAQYVESSSYVNKAKEENLLNRSQDDSLENYRESLENFYLLNHSSQIEALNIEGYEGWSATHIYNVVVLGLPKFPTPSDYSTTYFSYLVGNDGSILVDEKGYQKEVNARGLSDIKGLYKASYNKLGALLAGIDEKYAYGQAYIFQADYKARVIVTSSVAFAYLLVLPLFLKKGRMLGELFFHIGYADRHSGLAMRYYKYPLRMLFQFLLILIPLYNLNPYFVVLFMVFPYFFSSIMMLLDSESRCLSSRLLSIVPVDLDVEELTYKKSRQEVENSFSLPSYKQADYTYRLSSVDSFDDNFSKEKKDK